MNFKQKLAYMAIGCAFTLAGYFLAILGTGGFNSQNASAQDNTKQIIDEIITRKIRVVNNAGETVVVIDGGREGGGGISVYNKADSFFNTRNYAGNPVVSINTFKNGGSVSVNGNNVSGRGVLNNGF